MFANGIWVGEGDLAASAEVGETVSGTVVLQQSVFPHSVSIIKHSSSVSLLHKEVYSHFSVPYQTLSCN